MAVLFQTMILRPDLHANRGVLYIFGDNEQRKGLGGLAAECRGEPNAVGIRVKYAPRKDISAYWTEEDFPRVRPLIDDDFARVYRHVAKRGTVVIPSIGVGNGLAELPRRAPSIANYITGKIGGLIAMAEEQAKADRLALVSHQ